MNPRLVKKDTASSQKLAEGICDRTNGEVKTRKIIVVGNGMVSHRFTVEWLKLNPSSTDKLIIIGEESVPAYDRIHLTNGLAGNDVRCLELASSEWYANQQVSLHLDDPVIQIDRDNRSVSTHSTAVFEYDVLILATGSSARKIPIPGSQFPGVFVYRTLADLEAIQTRATQSRSAVVLGGGLLGLEAARALKDLGLRTHVIEASNGLMSRQLNKDASDMLLQRVSMSGIQVVTNCLTESITASENSLQLHFRDGRTLKTDMVVMTAGVEPRDELAKTCGIKTGARGGIMVNARLQTSDPSIYAIGECALPHGIFYGFAAPGFDMARVLAAHLNGKKAQFVKADYPVRLKLMGTELVTIGDIRGEGTLLTYRNRGNLKQILLTEGRVSGVSMLGSTEDVGRMHTAVLKQQRLWSIQQKRFLRTGSPWKPAGDDLLLWPATTAICQCTGVTRGQLSTALSEGCDTVESLTACTGAGSVCGSCRPLLAHMCGVTTTPAIKFKRVLLWTCVAATSLAVITMILKPLPMAKSVQTFRFDALWLNGTLKQVSGYSLLAVMVLGFLLPARKRLRALAKLGDYAFWRILHTTIGVITLVTLTAHTGFRLGFNLNKVLMLNMLTLTITGALAGGVIALSHRLTPANGRLLQASWTFLHTALCWPLFVFVLFHILTVYRY